VAVVVTDTVWTYRDAGGPLVRPGHRHGRRAALGDWIVKTAFGHYKPVSDAAIFAQYDRVGPAVSE
jgi:hypothetical protein